MLQFYDVITQTFYTYIQIPIQTLWQNKNGNHNYDCLEDKLIAVIMYTALSNSNIFNEP